MEFTRPLSGAILPDGSDALPALAFSGQADLGISRYSTNFLGISSVGSYVALFNTRTLSGTPNYKNGWVILGNGDAVTNTGGDTYLASITGQNRSLTGDVNPVFINIGPVTFTSTDNVTKTRATFNVELDKVTLVGFAGGTTWSQAYGTRVRFPVASTNATITKSAALTFTVAAGAEETGTVVTRILMDVPALNGSSTNTYGILFNDDPANGGIASLAGQNLSIKSGLAMTIAATANSAIALCGSGGTVKVIQTTPVTNGVNYINFTAAATTNGVTMAATGSDSNIKLILAARGTSAIVLSNVPQFSGTNTTGAGSALLGTNSPASTLTAPYTWIKAGAADGSDVYIPCWK